MTKSLSTFLPPDEDLVPALFPLLAPAEGGPCLPAQGSPHRRAELPHTLTPAPLLKG